VLSVLAFVAIVHSGRTLYALWMIAAEKIQITVVTTLFSLSYLVLVPLVWLFAWTRDSLKLRKAGESTYWVERRDEERTAEFFQRMG
jgi:drug/metabolite transporter (DMT)-like permease